MVHIEVGLSFISKYSGWFFFFLFLSMLVNRLVIFMIVDAIGYYWSFFLFFLEDINIIVLISLIKIQILRWIIFWPILMISGKDVCLIIWRQSPKTDIRMFYLHYKIDYLYFMFTKIKSLGIMLIHLWIFIFFFSVSSFAFSVKLSMRIELYTNAFRGHFCWYRY